MFDENHYSLEGEGPPSRPSDGFREHGCSLSCPGVKRLVHTAQPDCIAPTTAAATITASPRRGGTVEPRDLVGC
jgi:hypothetical protein